MRFNDSTPDRVEPEADNRLAPKLKETVKKEQWYVHASPYKLLIPYPQRLANSKIEGQFKKFMELLKHIHIIVPFMEAITQIPSYAKLLKEILSNKRKLDNNSTVGLTEECSAIIQNNMPPKLKDPWSFSIPCVISKYVINKALFDLGASMNLMPLSICERLDSQGLKPTNMSL
ncbi:uncharacterized protein LOC127135866 [Lathyrus oleraceus]|uniref:uncharacterized protein LOC127135866 n=1 Tax=Pisum sativum TaxID=3888 RepID=UPI0021D2305B|nr:uncharacterized protein LOC127135866 [Pisum sativum]